MREVSLPQSSVAAYSRLCADADAANEASLGTKSRGVLMILGAIGAKEGAGKTVTTFLLDTWDMSIHFHFSHFLR